MCQYVKTQSRTAATLFLIYYHCVFFSSCGHQKGAASASVRFAAPSTSNVFLTWYENSKQEHQLLVCKDQWRCTIEWASMFVTASQLFSNQSWWSKLCSQCALCSAPERQENWLQKFVDILSSRLDSPASKMKQTRDVELHTEIVAETLEAVQLHQRRAPTHSK